MRADASAASVPAWPPPTTMTSKLLLLMLDHPVRRPSGRHVALKGDQLH
jgi:hypothetical protein